MLAGLLGHHLTTLDIDFLRSLPDGLVVDLDRQLDLERSEPGLPSLLWSILWEASAARRLPPGFTKQVTFSLRGHRFTMELDLSESPECGYLLRNPTVAITRRLLRGGSTMLDIGANAGFHAISAGLLYRSVIAFEPTPATFARLERNIALSQLPNVRALAIALSDREGEASFAINPAHCGANRLADAPGAAAGQTVTVRLRTLDSLDAAASVGPIDFMKIDVEGHECEVIAGASKVIGRDRPTIVAEFNSPELFDRFRSLLPSGYRAVRDRSDGTSVPVAGGQEAVAARDVVFEAR